MNEYSQVVANLKNVWEASTNSELGFWDRWIETRGHHWPDGYQRRMDPELEIQPFLVDLLPDHNAPRILDIGCGPVTHLGRRFRGEPVEIVSVDPLADGYNELWQKHGVTPPVPVVPGFGETLLEQFDEASFDIVHSTNAIDHSADPIKFINTAVRLAKVGGRVFLTVQENEGVHANYSGLHQWNFEYNEAGLRLWNPEIEVPLASWLDSFGETKISAHRGRENGRMITIIIHRKAEEITFPL